MLVRLPASEATCNVMENVLTNENAPIDISSFVQQAVRPMIERALEVGDKPLFTHNPSLAKRSLHQARVHHASLRRSSQRFSFVFRTH